MISVKSAGTNWLTLTGRGLVDHGTQQSTIACHGTRWEVELNVVDGPLFVRSCRREHVLTTLTEMLLSADGIMQEIDVEDLSLYMERLHEFVASNPTFVSNDPDISVHVRRISDGKAFK